MQFHMCTSINLCLLINTLLLGDFNARVGRSVDVDDVIAMFGEDTCNASGNGLISF